MTGTAEDDPERVPATLRITGIERGNGESERIRGQSLSDDDVPERTISAADWPSSLNVHVPDQIQDMSNGEIRHWPGKGPSDEQQAATRSKPEVATIDAVQELRPAEASHCSSRIACFR